MDGWRRYHIAAVRFHVQAGGEDEALRMHAGRQSEVIVLTIATCFNNSGFRECPVQPLQLVQAFSTSVTWIDVENNYSRDLTGCDTEVRTRSLLPPAHELASVVGCVFVAMRRRRLL